VDHENCLLVVDRNDEITCWHVDDGRRTAAALCRRSAARCASVEGRCAGPSSHSVFARLDGQLSVLSSVCSVDDDISSSTTELVALDLPGHGLSSHKSDDGPPLVLAESVFYVAEAVRQLQWWPQEVMNKPELQENSSISQPRFTLVGHSMGAGISCLYAAAFPEQVDKLVLLEGGMSFL
jgi:pimeloyl-ACP methyl ester carboxylesterase